MCLRSLHHRGFFSLPFWTQGASRSSGQMLGQLPLRCSVQPPIPEPSLAVVCTDRALLQPAETITDLPRLCSLFSVLPSAQCRSQPSLVTLRRCSASLCSGALPARPCWAARPAPFHSPQNELCGSQPQHIPTAQREVPSTIGFSFRN